MSELSQALLEKYRPIRNRILVEVPGYDVTYGSSLELMPSERQVKTFRVMKIVKCGPECEHVKNGDMVFVDNSVGIEMGEPGDMISIKETDVVAVID